MNAKEERIVTNKELRFGEGMLDMISCGQKRSTMRWPFGIRELERGEVVTAKEGRMKMDIVILGSAGMYICEMNPILLLSDGFLNDDEAAYRMNEIYSKCGNKIITPESEVEMILFMPKDEFEELDDDVKKLLLETRTDLLFTHELTREYFLPTAAFWAGQRGITMNQWVDLLVGQGVFDDEEKEIISEEIKRSSYGFVDGMDEASSMEELYWIGEGEVFDELYKGRLSVPR